MRITELSLLLTLLVFGGCASSQESIGGVCLTGPPKEIDGSVMAELSDIGANWVCLMPYAYSPGGGAALSYDQEWQWWGEKSEGIEVLIAHARERNLKIMLKPHIWIGHGEFTGSYDAQTEPAWQAFENSYRRYVLHYAKLAELREVEILCLGTEMEKFVTERPQFWAKLITDIRAIYSGQLTYAANWDEVERFPLWPKLDLVGVDGYFPIATKDDESQAYMDAAWRTHFHTLDSLCESIDRPLLFCELGYRSCDACGIKPWEHSDRGTIDNDCQTRAYRAFFSASEFSSTYAGAFLWKWHSGLPQNNRKNTGYTPQRKPALNVVRQGFRQ